LSYGVGIAKDRTAGVRFLGRAKNISLHKVNTSSGAYPVSCPMDEVALFPELKQPGRQADHSLPSNAEIKNVKLRIDSPIRLHSVVLN
jgi:hypothetical protein